ncbi:FAD-dependent oxidoreductase [Paenibacillus sp. N1-5-1-14]|uniref:NAD(P)/FAD-dependent oxidoreductase n=1 Tax=Paenibacillus radicibacter TaxID=2972488 RepID=UPI002159515B|nr:FAD-dependent oxidoreductase [Paenibacillus radicibacter]MCR8645164.1 FAD-dependent oxidoreductase [Paenibacillus radicibacter]
MEKTNQYRVLFSDAVREPTFLHHIDYVVREDLYNLSGDALGKVITQINPDAIVTSDRILIAYLLDLQDLSLIRDSITLVYAINQEGSMLHRGNDRYHIVACADADLLEVQVLQYLEGQHNHKFVLHSRIATPKDAHIAIVGAGIVNLISALYLADQGYKLNVYAADPPPYNEDRWMDYGCTLSGSDARIFSFNESRHHHYYGNPLLEAPDDQYRKSVSENGWLSTPNDHLTASDWKWIEQFETYPQWVFQKIQNEIFDFNKESYVLWKSLIKQYPQLITESGYVDRLFRIYSTTDQYEAGVRSERALGAFIRELDHDEMKELFPSLQEAFAANTIHGVIEVEGFGIHIHKLASALLKLLQEKGAVFHWNWNFDRIEFNESGQVKSIYSGEEAITADCYVVSPGVPRNGFLQGTNSQGQLGAMIGCWVTLPNDSQAELSFPIKVARAGYASQEAAAGANIIPGVDRHGNSVIHISSGHGFLGLDSSNIHEAYLQDLSRAVHETARSLFPALYRKAEESGVFQSPIRYCIRPWTPSCLGVFETIPTSSDGLFVVTGGHNTGGFTHAMAVAHAVVKALDGHSHPMHRLYHPERLSSFFTAKDQTQSAVRSVMGLV